MESKILESFENEKNSESSNNKETYLRNELTRMSKENVSLRVYFFQPS
jgi:hypothetical protein